MPRGDLLRIFGGSARTRAGTSMPLPDGLCATRNLGARLADIPDGLCATRNLGARLVEEPLAHRWLFCWLALTALGPAGSRTATSTAELLVDDGSLAFDDFHFLLWNW